MQNENLTEKDIRAIGVAAWDAIKGKGKAEAESELIGSVILGIYPVNSCRMTEKRN